MDEAPDIPRYSGSKRSNRDEFLVDRTGEPPRKRARRDIIDDDDI